MTTKLAEPAEGRVFIELDRTETDEGHEYNPIGLYGLEMIANAAGSLRAQSGVGGPLYFVLEADDTFIEVLRPYATEFI